MSEGFDQHSGLMRLLSRTPARTRDALGSNKIDHEAPRETGNVQNELQDNPADTNHLGATKVLVATYEPGDYVLIGSTGGKVSLYKYEKADRALDPGATSENGKIFTTGDSLAKINQANRRTWARGPKYNNGARQTFTGKP